MSNNTFSCGLDAALAVIGGKWKPIILCHLKHGTKRTSELKRLMPSITQKMLTQQLRELEADGVVTRIVYEQVPPKVEYSLSSYGQSLAPVLELLCLWGEKHIEQRVSLYQEDIVLENTELT